MDFGTITRFNLDSVCKHREQKNDTHGIYSMYTLSIKKLPAMVFKWFVDACQRGSVLRNQALSFFLINMPMKKQTKEEINKYTSPNSCLYHNEKGIFRKKTPFKVKCIAPIGAYKKGQTVVVSKVRSDAQMRILYLIDNELYRHSYFELIK
jgi:hypothetical protein